MAALNGGFGQSGFDSFGVWNGQAAIGPQVGAVSLQALAATPATPTIPSIDPVLAATMAQLQADFDMRQMAME